nr:hypothetical protein [Pirellulaceae bacterium]
MEGKATLIKCDHDAREALTVVSEVTNEVRLGIESSKEFLGHVSPLFSSHQLWLLLLLEVHGLSP